MRLTLIFGFFLSLNFLLILFPRLMPNVISVESTVFWLFWVNGMFLLTLLLPAKASYIFNSKGVGSVFGKAFMNTNKRSSLSN
tara:strand:- start:9602 stop:9850 length:249 start_codon:yes stop_codon:yes gene_type:complete